MSSGCWALDMRYMTTPSTEAPFSEVSLRVPDKLHFQLVFRRELPQAVLVREVKGVQFCVFDSLGACMANLALMRQALGQAGAIKAVLKVLRGRVFYLAHEQGRVLHTGWVTFSFCRFYRVEQGDAVIGPIWSAEAARGRGVAVYATQMILNVLFSKGVRVCFIDTSNGNVPCLKVIEHAGFGYPVGVFLRD